MRGDAGGQALMTRFSIFSNRSAIPTAPNFLAYQYHPECQSKVQD